MGIPRRHFTFLAFALLGGCSSCMDWSSPSDAGDDALPDAPEIDGADPDGDADSETADAPEDAPDDSSAEDGTDSPEDATAEDSWTDEDGTDSPEDATAEDSWTDGDTTEDVATEDVATEDVATEDVATDDAWTDPDADAETDGTTDPSDDPVGDDAWAFDLECEQAEVTAAPPDRCAIRVDADSTSTSPDGLTWGSAYQRVGDGIDAAMALFGSCTFIDVWVAEGIYHVYETAPTDTILLVAGVRLYGGFAGTEASLDDRAWRTHRTVLDGHAFPGSAERVMHVVTGDDYTALDGFVITGGQTTTYTSSGAGLYCPAGCPVIRNCVFTGNEATFTAGISAVSPTLSLTCSIVGSNTGAGLSVANSALTIEDCLFADNTGTSVSAYRCPSARIAGSEFRNGSGLSAHEGTSLEIVDTSFLSNGLASGGYGFSASANGEGRISNVTVEGFGGPGCNIATGEWIIDGLVVRANGGGCRFGHSYVGSDPETFDVTRSVFDSNSSPDDGGGLWIQGAVTLDSCEITDNVSAGNGGGIFVVAGNDLTVTGSLIQGNTAVNGGAMAATTGTEQFVDTVIRGNHAELDGGAMYLIADGLPTLERCRVSANTAGRNGGAFYGYDNGSPVSSASLFHMNSAGGSGGVFWGDWASSPSFYNCTLSDNASATEGGAVWVQDGEFFAVNTIFWGNAPDEIVCLLSPLCGWMRCDISGLPASGDNLAADPLFVDPSMSDYHLSPGSPCVDAGLGTTDVDLDGNPRVDDPATPDTGSDWPPWSDIGAFELQPP